jgi:uncharacterized protein
MARSSIRTLIVFARAPRLGRVKRRLARTIGDLAALRFYRRTLARLLRAVGRDRRWRILAAVTPDHARLPGLRIVGQGRGDLGQRMARMMLRARGPVVLVGADIPALGPGQIAAAFRALGSHDVVFGPARDGGYYLVAAKRPRLARWMFAQVRWSTEHALADTRANLTHRRVALVDTLDDVDDAAALSRLAR